MAKPITKTPEEFQQENHERLAKGGVTIIEPPKKYLEILQDKNLLEKVMREVEKKVVGEDEPKKVMWNFMNMRMVENLGKGVDNLIANAKSGTGKDHVGEALFDLIHQTEKEELIKTTPKVLSYTRNRNEDPNATWNKCCLRLEDVTPDLLNDNSFKVFLSANPNKINSGKSVNKGKVINIEIEGKPSIIITAAETALKKEQLRRLPMIYLDEGKLQTIKILNMQAEEAESGLIKRYDSDLKIALRFLKRVKVKIPFAKSLTKVFDDSTDDVIARTAFPRFLACIKSSAAFHQYQRGVDGGGFVIANEFDFDYGALCLRKTTTNIRMIPLSRVDSKVYEVLKTLDKTNLEDFTNNKEIQRLGYSESWIRKRLDFLVGNDFSERWSERVEGIKKPVNYYKAKLIGELRVPTWKELMKKSPNEEYKEISVNNPFNENNSGINGLSGLFPHKMDVDKCTKCGKDGEINNGAGWICKPCAGVSQ